MQHIFIFHSIFIKFTGWPKYIMLGNKFNDQSAYTLFSVRQFYLLICVMSNDIFFGSKIKPWQVYTSFGSTILLTTKSMYPVYFETMTNLSLFRAIVCPNGDGCSEHISKRAPCALFELKTVRKPFTYLLYRSISLL